MQELRRTGQQLKSQADEFGVSLEATGTAWQDPSRAMPAVAEPVASGASSASWRKTADKNDQ